MKNDLQRSSKDKKAILFGYLWRWLGIGSIVLIPMIATGICRLMQIPNEVQRVVWKWSLGGAMFFVGGYNLVGTLLRLKHLLVAAQLMAHVSLKDLDPNRPWTEKEKKDELTIGVILMAFGLAMIFLLDRLMQ